MSFASVDIFVLTIFKPDYLSQPYNCMYILCLGAHTPNRWRARIFLTASVQVNAFNFPCRIIFKSKGNINCIIVPWLDFGKKQWLFRSHPIFFCFTHLKEVAAFFCPHVLLPTLFLMCAFISSSVCRISS